MQNIEHLEGAICNLTLRLAFNLGKVIDDQLEYESFAKIGADSIHVKLIVEQFALLI